MGVVKKSKKFMKHPENFSESQLRDALAKAYEMAERQPALSGKRISKINKAVSNISEGLLSRNLDPSKSAQEAFFSNDPDRYPGYGGEGSFEGAQPGSVEEYLSQVGADPDFLDQFKGKNAVEKLMAWTVQDAAQGRRFGVEEFQQRRDAFEADPLVAALQQQSQDLLSKDLFSEQDIAKMIGSSDARLSQSYGNQAAGMQNVLGGRGIGQDSGVAQELAAGLRFNTLQQGAQNATGIQMQAQQMNRSALEDAMRLGLGTAGFVQGAQNMFSSNISNLLAGQPLAQVGPEAAATAAALQAPGPSNNWFASPQGQGVMGIFNTLYGSSEGGGGGFMDIYKAFG